MRLEMRVEMQIEILDGQSSGLFSNEPFEKRPVTTIEDFVLHSDDHFESNLLGNELYLPTLTPSTFVDSLSAICHLLSFNYLLGLVFGLFILRGFLRG